VSGQQGKQALPEIEPTASGDALYKVLGNAARVLYKLIARVEITGRENLPSSGGYIIVANHTTELDPVTVAFPAFVEGALPRFLAKDSLFRAPVLGYIMRKLAHIPVVRGSVDARKSLITARKIVEAGGAVVIFPEGTTTHDPQLWPMQARTGAAPPGPAAGAEGGERGLAAVAGRVAELPLALGHDVQAIAEIAFVEESLSATQGRMTHLLLEGHLLCIIKATEQRHLADEVSVTDHGAELLPLVPDCSGVSIWIAQWIPYVIPLTRRYRASHHYALSIR